MLLAPVRPLVPAEGRLAVAVGREEVVGREVVDGRVVVEPLAVGRPELLPAATLLVVVGRWLPLIEPALVPPPCGVAVPLVRLPPLIEPFVPLSP